jgi:hypothetical protein
MIEEQYALKFDEPFICDFILGKPKEKINTIAIELID